MKKTVSLFMVAAFLVFTGISSAQVICGTPQTTTLIAGQYMDAGDVVIGNDDAYLYVTFIAENGWTITETHVAVGASLIDLPQNKGGNPKVGKFMYQGEHNNVLTVVYAIPLSELGVLECGVVAAHAVVEKRDGFSVQEETAWGKGSQFTGRNWAMYMSYCKQSCDG